MRSIGVAMALALAFPAGAPAADASIGFRADTPKMGAVAGWNSPQDVAVRLASRETDAPRAAAWSDHVYRYGEHEPRLEELPMTGRAPAIGSNRER
jgi:hypothetical protein